jgi:hypothetical protein
VSEVIELVLVVDESCHKFGFISQEAIERTLLFEFVFSNGFPLSKTTLHSVSETTSTSSMTSDTKMLSLFHGNTYIYGETFNFNNPQSSQKRQSDDSGLQIAKTKYKRI